MCAPTPLIEESATLKLRPLCGRSCNWPVRTYRQWRKEVRKREGTGSSMSGARIFLRTYIRVAAFETSIRSCG